VKMKWKFIDSKRSRA